MTRAHGRSHSYSLYAAAGMPQSGITLGEFWRASSGQSGFHQHVTVLGLQLVQPSMMRLAKALMSSTVCYLSLTESERSPGFPATLHLCHRCRPEHNITRGPLPLLRSGQVPCHGCRTLALYGTL